MRFHGFLRFLFVQYCIAAGVLLVVAPWSMIWERLLLQIPAGTFWHLAAHVLFRGGVSGFGLIHLVWAFHDLETLLSSRKGHGTQPAP